MSTLPDVLTVDEVARLLDSIPVSQNREHDGVVSEFLDDPVMLRDKALLEFMYATGARVSEACGANLDDVDVDGRISKTYGQRHLSSGWFPSAAMRAKHHPVFACGAS